MRSTHRTIIACLLGLSIACPVFAQSEPKQDESPKVKKATTGRTFAKIPLLRMWFKMDEAAAAGYMTDLMKEYEVESKFMSGQLAMQARNVSSEPELMGAMVFMAKGLIPSAVQMTFRSVENPKEFKDLIFRARTQLGAAATLNGKDDHYWLDLDFSKGIPVFNGETGEDGEPEMMAFPGMDQIQNNPAAMAGMKQTLHFRLVENVMWQGNMPEIMDFDFPTYEQLQPKSGSRKYDAYGEFNLEEIPGYLKGMLFNAVKVAANTKLQQRDEEDSLDYETRRANGDLWLELLRTIVYDVNKGSFSLQMADEEKQLPIRLRLDIEARSESQLAKVGRIVGDAGTHFNALRSRKAPLTFATTWGMPELTKKLLSATLAQAEREWNSEFANNETMLGAANRLGELLKETINKGRTDMAVQLTGDVLTGFAVVGGIQLENAPEFSESLDELISNYGETDRIEHSEDKEGRKYVTVGTGEVLIPGTEGAQFESSVTFTTFDSCLWFSYGGPSAQALLEDTVAYSEEHRKDGTRKTSTIQFAFDLGEWMKGDEDVEGFNQYPRQAMTTLERKIDEGLGAMQGILSGGEPGEVRDRGSFIEKALKRGGDEIDMRFNVTKSGIDLDLNIGLGVANMLMARMLDAQGQIMDAMMSNKSGTFNIPGAAGSGKGPAIQFDLSDKPQ